jgi:hypothetical protein
VTIKSERGRRRYIVFKMPVNADRFALNQVLPNLPQVKVIHCEDGMAVVRCSPEGRDTIISVIEEKFPGSASLKTSGTLKTLRDQYGPLGKRRKPSRKKDTVTR